MKKTDLVEKLKHGAEVWNLWRVQQPTGHMLDLSGANLNGANLRHANLENANFKGATLIEADLFCVILSNANLENANLENANLKGAILSGANLKKAILEGANLKGANLDQAILLKANLKGANLTNSHLSNANLIGTNLFHVNLTNAIFYETGFGDTDLTTVTGLETANHNGPSILDHRTIERSGNLPINFLRGCGLPELLIEYLPSLQNQSISYYSCFISYSHADKIFARRLHDQLQGCGIRCWLDEHQLLPGDDIYERVDQGIKLWDKVLLCASKDALTSWWVDSEIDIAFKKEQKLMKQRGKKVWALIPLNLDGHLFSGEWERGFAGQVKNRLAADFTGWEADNDKFEQAFEKVVNALKTDDAGRESTPCPKL